MKTLLKTFSLTGLLLVASKAVMAAPCDPGVLCEAPSSNASTQAGWTVSASGMSGLKSLVSVGPTGNAINSQYYFGVNSTDAGASIANGGFTPGGSGARVISSAFASNASSTPGATVSGGAVQQILGGTVYYVYAQACPSGTGIYNSANCSAWTRIGNTTTLAYPTSVFSAPVAPTDATTASLNYRTNVPTADASNISLVRLSIVDMINAANNQTLSPIGWPGNGTFAVTNAEYTQNGGFKPNVKYQYLGQVVYPFATNVPTAGAQTRGPFWTTPVNPSNVTVTNITHCSAEITARNAAGNPANPAYTTYNLCMTGTGGSCTSGTIAGTGIATDTITRTFNGLLPGTSYTPSAQALVGNGDGSQTGWNSSSVVNGTGFTTAGTGGTFTITAITTNSGTFNFPVGFDTTGATSWQIVINGAATGPSGVGLPPTSIAISGLNPNTQYSIRIQISENSCTYTVPAAPGAQFYTLPAAPTGGSLSATGPRTLLAGWTDVNPPTGNPNGATYTVQRCTDAGFTTGCATQSATKASTSPSATITSGILPETQYFVRVKTVSASGTPANDSAWLSLGNVTTPNEAPNITTITSSIHTSSVTLRATITDNGPSNELICHWTRTSPASGVTTNFVGNDTNAACTQIQMTFNPVGAYTVQLVVRDKNDTGLTDTETHSFSPGQTPTTIDAITALNGATIVVGNTKGFQTVVRDQFGAIINGQTVNWSLSNAGATRTPTSSTFTIVTGVNSTLSPVTLTASLPGLTSQTLSLTILASGPQFTVAPRITLNSDNVTGTLVTDAIDNSPGAGTMIYTWSIESGPTTSATFAPNGTAAAKNSVVTFTQAGTYVLRATIQDNFGTEFALTSSATVVQRLTGLTVSPNNVTIKILADQVFTATGVDQFNDAMSPTGVVWSTTGGNVSGAGVFNSPALGNNIRITARSGSITGAATVNVVNFDVSSAIAFPVPFKGNRDTAITFRGLGSSSQIRIFTVSGKEVFSIDLTQDTWPWDVKNSSGENLASGVYFYRIQSPEGKKDGKLIIIR